MASSGLQSKYVPFTASVNGQYYGSGALGWYRNSAGGVASTYTINIMFDSINEAYALTLNGMQYMYFDYDRTVFDNAYISGWTYSINTANGNIQCPWALGQYY